MQLKLLEAAVKMLPLKYGTLYSLTSNRTEPPKVAELRLFCVALENSDCRSEKDSFLL